MTVVNDVPRRRARHGTPAGYVAHLRRDERPCNPCYIAQAAYDARRREAPEKVRADRLRSRAQRAALGRLKDVYPDLYRTLYAEEKRRLLREEAILAARDE